MRLGFLVRLIYKYRIYVQEKWTDTSHKTTKWPKTDLLVKYVRTKYAPSEASSLWSSELQIIRQMFEHYANTSCLMILSAMAHIW